MDRISTKQPCDSCFSNLDSSRFVFIVNSAKVFRVPLIWRPWSKVRDTNVSGLELSVTKHITRSAQDPDGVMTRFWQVAASQGRPPVGRLLRFQSHARLCLSPIAWQARLRRPANRTSQEQPSGTPRPSTSRIATLDALA